MVCESANWFQTLKNKQSLLGQGVASLPKIYFDVNYFIDFRKYLDGEPVRKYVAELYRFVTELIRRELIAVPVSDIHIWELFKRIEKNEYGNMLRLLDDISGGLCFAPRHRRWENELLSCLRTMFGIRDAERLFYAELWTKPFFLLDERLPTFDGIPESDGSRHPQMVQSFIDFAWERTLSEVLSISESTLRTLNPKPIEDEFTKYLLQKREQSKDEFKTFKELLAIEIHGSIDARRTFVDELLTSYFADYVPGSSAIADELFSAKPDERSARLIHSMVWSIVNTSQFGVLPDVTIGACLHSLKRIDLGSKYKQTDTFDFLHASVALPYCSYFFTDHSLAGLIKHGSVRLDKSFNCTVLSTAKEVYEKLAHDFAFQLED